MDLHVAETNGRFWKGAWDGGYDTNSEYVGLGFKIWATDEVEVVDEMLQPVRWVEKAYGVGSVKGEGATTAEVMAFQCLVMTLHALMMNKEVPIEECLGIPVSRHLFAHSCPIPSLESNLRSFLDRKRKQEMQAWGGPPRKFAKIQLDSDSANQLEEIDEGMQSDAKRLRSS